MKLPNVPEIGTGTRHALAVAFLGVLRPIFSNQIQPCICWWHRMQFWNGDRQQLFYHTTE
jgi:hypothetical protein